jgi:transcriptional regulator with XRE-family HTH domain
MRGYSQVVIEANQNAEPSLGVTLGAVCITTKYPASKVAKELNISRQSVYDWFSGKTKPSKDKVNKVNDLIQRLTLET